MDNKSQMSKESTTSKDSLSISSKESQKSKSLVTQNSEGSNSSKELSLQCSKKIQSSKEKSSPHSKANAPKTTSSKTETLKTSPKKEIKKNSSELKKVKLDEKIKVYKLIATDGKLVEKQVKIVEDSDKKIISYKTYGSVKLVNFKSTEGEIQCSENDAKLSPYLANLIEVASRDSSPLMIPSDISFDIFEKVIEYCVLHISFLTHSKQSVLNLSPTVQTNQQSNETQTSGSKTEPHSSADQSVLSSQSILDNDEKLYQRRKKEREYLSDTQQDQAKLFALVRAAEKLQIEDLLNLTCETVANNYVKGKNIDQIRTLFNIECDLTAEEINRIDAENNFYDKDFDF